MNELLSSALIYSAWQGKDYDMNTWSRRHKMRIAEKEKYILGLTTLRGEKKEKVEWIF